MNKNRKKTAITLFGRSGTGSDAPQMLMEELQIDYRFQSIPSDDEGHNQLLELNPRLQVPVLDLDGHVITESAAICLAICEIKPGCSLLPAVGTGQRAEVYRWLFYAVSNIYESCLRYYYPDRFAQQSSCAEAVKQAALSALGRHWAIVENELSQHDSAPWWLDSMGLLDIYFSMLINWQPDCGAFLASHPNLAELYRAVGCREAALSLGIAQAV